MSKDALRLDSPGIATDARRLAEIIADCTVGGGQQASLCAAGPATVRSEETVHRSLILTIDFPAPANPVAPDPLILLTIEM